MSDLSKRIEELEKGMVVLNQVISTSEETEAKLRVRIEALKLGQQAIALTYQHELTKANALIERIELALYAAKDGIDRLLPRYAPKEGVAERPIVVDALAQIAAYRSGG